MAPNCLAGSVVLHGSGEPVEAAQGLLHHEVWPQRQHEALEWPLAAVGFRGSSLEPSKSNHSHCSGTSPPSPAYPLTVRMLFPWGQLSAQRLVPRIMTSLGG